MKDYYYILGVDANCTTDEVKDAYRKLSKKFHPDLNQNDSYFESRFKEIQEAYEILSDPAKRRRYNDQFINAKIYPTNPESAKQRRYPRTTAVDIIFTIVLIGITVLFAKYVMSSMSGTTKTVKVSQAPAIADTPLVVSVPVKHHKKKKHSFIADANAGQKLIPVKKEPVPMSPRPAMINNNIAKAAPVKIKPDTFKPHPVVVVTPVRTVSNTASNNEMPYSSYIRGNITGVVNMHRMDNLNSDIVAVIPSHSKVMVLQKGDSYYKIQYNGDEGYVPKWTVLTK